MTVRLANNSDRGQWDDFVISSPGGSFLQSWAWGELQGKLGVPYWRLVVEGVSGWQAAALVIRREVLGGRCWLYVPRGPVFSKLSKVSELSSKEDGVLREELLELAKKERAVFVRMDPAVREEEWLPFAEAIGGGLALRKAEWEVQPRHTLVLSLDSSEAELLAGMHQKTRYNIRLAERRGVKIRFSREQRDGEEFLRLAKDVTQRGGFHFHPDSHYRAMLEVLASPGMLELAVAEYNGAVLGVYWLITFAGVVTYVHGATSSGRREVMAPHLLMWECIKRARQQGAKSFDFGGVAPPAAKAMGGKPHAWAGITRFKEGFGGERRSYAGAYDYVLQPGMYAVFNWARRARAVWR